FLLLGLVVSSVGTMNMNRWVREPRADQALAQGLKGFDDRYVLYSYYLPAPHVLLSPTGLYVLTTMGQDGVIRYDGDKFRRDFSAGRLLRFMAEEGMGKPLAEAGSQVQALQKALDEHDAGEGVEIQNLLVFYNPRAELVLSDTSQPVVTTKGLKKAIRKQQRADQGEPLSNTQYRELRGLFDQSVTQ
ncbi:MAG: nuclease-related domain-containing protein, partial [Anaerolineae bacterium]